MMIDIRSQHFGHHSMQIFGGYIRIQGLAKNLVEKLRHMTVFNPQQWKIDDLKNILFSQMNIRERSDVPVEIDLVFMLKDNVIFQRHYNEETFNSMYEIYNHFVKLGSAYDINHQRG